MIIVVGAGLAGISAALALAPLDVTVITASPIGTQSASAWAQGGIAAAVGLDDSPALHAADTLAAGDGLCDPAIVTRITAAAPALIAALDHAGARFDRTSSGRYDLGLEAAHRRRRIVHVADGTGAEVMRALAAKLRATPSITVRHARVDRLMLHAGRIAGVQLADGATLQASHVVLATGGIGGLYAHTTNPLGSWGHGLLLAGRAGAVLADLEFVQFHPTALDAGGDPMPLISEAMRGEGGTLIDEHGTRFANELAARDVVSRAVSAHLAADHRVYLDATAFGASIATHFPTITAACRAAGIDPSVQPIPIRPAAHYHMGGIETDAAARTTIPGLHAIGECAATGLHGANRLASNSLLEAAVGGVTVADTIRADPAPANLPRIAVTHLPRTQAHAPHPIRAIMSRDVGVLRSHLSLTRALADLAPYQGGAAEIARAIALSARRRTESRGAHARTDHPDHAPIALRSRITLAEANQHAATPERTAA